jgi:single-strand DNA-binding protein
MSGFNQAVILGRLVAAPEELTTKGGKLFLKAIIATSVRQRNNDGTFEERTSFIPATIFGKQAEVFRKYVRKGDLVHLVGRLDSNEYTTSSGEKRLSLSFIVEQLNLLPNARASKQAPETSRASKPPAPAPSQRERAIAPAQPELDENGDPTQIPF